MLAVQQKLATVDQLNGRGFHLVNRCYLCKSDAESVDHLFFKCHFTAELLSHIMKWLNISASFTDLPSLILYIAAMNQRKAWRYKLKSCSIGALVYSIWQERNARAFEGKELPITVLTRRIQFTVSAVLLNSAPEAIYDEVLLALDSTHC
ncbi:uncharacterized protein LOC141620240 [Silene latifolia]|uniref:uncharacterized protein LOC141620240 n=1 Tax=Silene latifolia TaxID=37657 RepID=UPI003D7833C4